MIESVLIIISISILIFININHRNSKKALKFEEILDVNKTLEKSKLLFELKHRDFIDKVFDEYSDLNTKYKTNKEKNEIKDCPDNQKLIIFKEMIKDKKTEIEICRKLNIGRGEFLLLRNLYKK